MEGLNWVNKVQDILRIRSNSNIKEDIRHAIEAYKDACKNIVIIWYNDCKNPICDKPLKEKLADYKAKDKLVYTYLK
jgi:hypothetical protein